MIVAALTGKRQIFGIVSTSGLYRKDVLDRKTFRCEPFLAAAILAETPGA